MRAAYRRHQYGSEMARRDQGQGLSKRPPIAVDLEEVDGGGVSALTIARS